MRLSPLWAIVVAALALAACATVRPAGAAALRIECNVPDAGIWIDDVLVGRVSEWSKPGRFIRPGFHRVEIRHPSYFTHYAEVSATDSGEAVVTAELRPLLDS